MGHMLLLPIFLSYGLSTDLEEPQVQQVVQSCRYLSPSALASHRFPSPRTEYASLSQSNRLRGDSQPQAGDGPLP